MRRLASLLAWWGGLFVLWLLLVGTVAQTELIAGLVAAALGAAAVEVVRSQGLLTFRVEWRWVRRTPRQLARVAPDFFRVLATIFRPRRGVFRTMPFPTGGNRAVDHGRRAWVGFAASLAPNRLVVDVDADRGEVLVHDLVPSVADEEILR